MKKLSEHHGILFKKRMAALSLLIYLYIVVRNAVRKKITIFIQYATNQTVGHAKRSAKCGAKIEKEPDNAPWV